MRSILVRTLAACCLSTVGLTAAAAEVGDDPFAAVPFENVAMRGETAASRFYVTGLLGSSFATLDDRLYFDGEDRAINGTVLTAGGAVGVAYARNDGRLRLEFEGRGRDDLTRFVPVDPATGGVQWGARDGWSTLVNLWRDVSVTDRLDVYAGGGLGGGGYRFGFGGEASFDSVTFTYSGGSNAATFAWQAGGGVVWNVTDRVAFDVGYRFFALEPAGTTLRSTIDGEPGPTFADVHRFTASELLFGLRIYEPFRRWR